MNKKAGFTLSELCSLLCIIAVLSFAIAMFSNTLDREEACMNAGVDCINIVITPEERKIEEVIK